MALYSVVAPAILLVHAEEEHGLGEDGNSIRILSVMILPKRRKTVQAQIDFLVVNVSGDKPLLLSRRDAQVLKYLTSFCRRHKRSRGDFAKPTQAARLHSGN